MKELSKFERIVVNSLTPLDAFYYSVVDFRSYKSSFKRLYEKKIGRTEKLLEMRVKHGFIGPKARNVCYKNPCGIIRYWVAQSH